MVSTKTISYSEYFDKVFGCWLGKSFCGTIGAPFEGRKELFSYTYDEKSIEVMLPNDDLDLQILWLEVLETKGFELCSEDLAALFSSRCPYSPGEYAVFKSNYRNGIMPPVSGTFNNSYYLNGMGCPIRSEIWACCFPGAPEIAKKYSIIDGYMDHGAESVEGEIFLAVAQSMAFFLNDIPDLIDNALSFINPKSKMFRLIRDVVDWCQIETDFRAVRERLLRQYGHPDCTNVFQNMGIIVYSLLLGENDIIKTTMMALNSGFDTDCTCATTGALLGIIKGGRHLISSCGFKDTGYVLGVDAVREDYTLRRLAVDTCAIGVAAGLQLEGAAMITEAPTVEPLPQSPPTPIGFSVTYGDMPCISFGEHKQVTLHLRVHTEQARGYYSITAALPTGWEASYPKKIMLTETTDIPFELKVPGDLPSLQRSNRISVSFKGESSVQTFSFGVFGAMAWRLYGPYFDNLFNLPHINFWESYYPYIEGKDSNQVFDRTRQFHLNFFANIHKDYLQQKSYSPPKIVSTYEEKISLKKLISYDGSCCVYLEGSFLYYGKVKPLLLVGHSAPFKLWLNGQLIMEEARYDYWTGENRHFLNLPIIQGENRLLIKLIRTGSSCDFSFSFREGDKLFTDIICDFAWQNPKHYIEKINIEPNTQ